MLSAKRLRPLLLLLLFGLLAPGANAFHGPVPLALRGKSLSPAPSRQRPRDSLVSAAGMSLQSIEPGPRMSSAVIHNGVVYTCGCVCEEGGETKDIVQQAKDALADLDRVLGLAKSDKHHIMSMQVWVDDLSDVPGMNSVYDEWVSKTMPPGRATVQSKLIAPYKVEFRAIAAQIE